MSACAARLARSDAVLVTSVTRPFLDHARNLSYRRLLWSSPSHALAAAPPLVVYTENAWEVAHGRRPLARRDLPPPAPACVLDGFNVQRAKLARAAPKIRDFYSVRGLPSPALSESVMDGARARGGGGRRGHY